MLQFIYSQLIFYISIGLLLFLPGYFLLRSIEARKKYFTNLERLVLSFAFSFTGITFLTLVMGKAGILFTRPSILLAVFLAISVPGIIFLLLRKKYISEKNEPSKKIIFTKKQFYLIIILLFFAVFTRTAYLTDTIFPSATDLGHHMFWVEKITETGELPQYEKSDLVEKDGRYLIDEPRPIDDFIVGEHLIFAAVFLISKLSVISAYPSLILYLINIIGILAIFILTLRLFEASKYAQTAAIFSLLLAGPLYAASSSQANFISGGVIGNLIGNLIIPLVIYFYFRALNEKNALLFILGMFLNFSLFYFHHLSAFLLIFILAFISILLFFFNIQNILSLLGSLKSVFWRRSVLIFVLGALAFFFFIAKPAYIESQAVKTIIGEPTRITKEGLSLSQLKFSVGEARAALGIVGVGILLLFLRRLKYQSAIIAGWVLAIFLLSWKPRLFQIDIPSARIANYLVFPMIIGGAFALSWMLEKIASNKNQKYWFSAPVFFLMMFFLFINGLYDNNQSFKINANNLKTIETFHSAKYLSQKIKDNDLVIKDHNYLASDSWMKLYFKRDYNYPLTRSYFFRYETATGKREMCTNWMISAPGNPESEKCFDDTGTNFVIVNPLYDSAQFKKLNNFDQVYASNGVNIYYKK